MTPTTMQHPEPELITSLQNKDVILRCESLIQQSTACACSWVETNEANLDTGDYQLWMTILGALHGFKETLMATASATSNYQINSLELTALLRLIEAKVVSIAAEVESCIQKFSATPTSI